MSSEVPDRSPVYPDIEQIRRETAEIIARTNRRQRNERLKTVAKALLYPVGIALLVSRCVGDDEPKARFDDKEFRATPKTDIESRLTKTAIKITGDSGIDVYCGIPEALSSKDDSSVFLGRYVPAKELTSKEPLIVIDAYFCEVIDAPDEYGATSLAFSTFVLAHEIVHDSGELNEGITNCLAVDLYPRVADSLGITEMLIGIDPLSISKTVGTEEYHTEGC